MSVALHHVRTVFARRALPAFVGSAVIAGLGLTFDLMMMQRLGVEFGISFSSVMISTSAFIFFGLGDGLGGLRIPLGRRRRGLLHWLAIAGPALLPWLAAPVVVRALGHVELLPYVWRRVLLAVLVSWVGAVLPARWNQGVLFVVACWVMFGSLFMPSPATLDWVAAGALLLASLLALLPLHRWRAPGQPEARPRETPAVVSRPEVSALAGPRRTLSAMWWLGWREQARGAIPGAALFMALVIAAGFVDGSVASILGLVAYMVVTLGFLGLSDPTPLGLPQGSLNAMLCVPVPVYKLARLVVLHGVLFRSLVFGVVLSQCHVFDVDSGSTRWNFLELIVKLHLVMLPWTCMHDLESRFPRSAPGAALWVALLAGLGAVFFVMPQMLGEGIAIRPWSPARVVGAAIASGALIAAFLYELRSVLPLLFPRSQEWRLRAREAGWMTQR